MGSYRYLINIFTFDNIRYIHKIATTAIWTTRELYDCTKQVENNKWKKILLMRTTFDNSISAFCQAINDYFEYFHFTLYTLIYMVDIS